jgi:flagellar motor switch protein FliG
MSVAHDYVLKGGVESARNMLINAFGPEQARSLLDRLMKTIGSDAANFDALQKADPQQLAKFIHSEHPQTIALILSHLKSSQAAALLSSLPAEMRPDVALRMAHLDQISPDIIARIATIIGQKLKALGELNRESYGGIHAVAEMFNRLDAGSSKEILDNIEVQDPSLVETVRHLMFVFEDLLTVDSNAIKEILSRVDRKMLTLALKGTSENLRNHFLGNMSQRGAEMLREEMDTMGPVKIKDVEGAQQQIISVVRQLENEGVISMKGGGGGEQYVL